MSKSRCFAVALAVICLPVILLSFEADARSTNSIKRQVETSKQARISALVCEYLARFLANVNSPSRSLFAVARPTVCMSVCLLSVTFVRPTQAVQIFGNISTDYVPWPSVDIH